MKTKREPFLTKEEFRALMRLLLADQRHCWEGMHQAANVEDQNFWKRAFTRSVFALIEGFCEYFRSQALTAETNRLAAGDFSFEPGKLCVLLGQSCYVDNEGEIRSQELRIPFLANLLFCFNSYAEAHKITHRIRKGGHCWEKIRLAVAVRDNLMHPKDSKSFNIAEEQIENVAFTLAWFYKEFHFILKEIDGKDLDFPDEIYKLKLKKFN